VLCRLQLGSPFVPVWVWLSFGWCAYTCTCVLVCREDVYDLLRPGTGPLNVREDIRKGVYVEGLCERVVENGKPRLMHFDWRMLNCSGEQHRQLCVAVVCRSRMTDGSCAAMC
jgi:hypothetical protein